MLVLGIVRVIHAPLVNINMKELLDPDPRQSRFNPWFTPWARRDLAWCGPKYIMFETYLLLRILFDPLLSSDESSLRIMLPPSFC